MTLGSADILFVATKRGNNIQMSVESAYPLVATVLRYGRAGRSQAWRYEEMQNRSGDGNGGKKTKMKRTEKTAKRKAKDTKYKRQCK